jgi:uncharacterized membrane protein
MEHLKSILGNISFGIDLAGISILLVGFIKGIILYIKSEFLKQNDRSGISLIQALRCKIGVYILLSLDFLIASDIIHSIIHKELKDLYELGIIVVLRTTIGYFLGNEIKEIEEHELK